MKKFFRLNYNINRVKIAMKILIPRSEGKAKVQPSDILFKDANFQFIEYTTNC